MIPLSTALGDPVWYHKGSKDKGVVFVDNHNVINGLRINPIVPGSSCSNLCRGRDNCEAGGNPDTCAFLAKYYEQLKSINYEDFIKNLESHILMVCKKYKINEEPFAVFMVHEAFTNPCSERVIIQRWFEDNGLRVTELNPKEY